MAIFQDRNGKELSIGEASARSGNRFYNYIADLSLFFLHILVNIPSHHLRRFFMRIAGAKIGKGSSIHMDCSFFSLRKLKIGEDSIIGRGVFIDGRDIVRIGNHVAIASDVMIYSSEHDINSEDFSAILGSVEIGDFVFIGPRVMILPGVKIGKGAILAAGAVITKDVEDFKIVGGVPAVIIGERALKNLHYKLGRARLFQ